MCWVEAVAVVVAGVVADAVAVALIEPDRIFI